MYTAFRICMLLVLFSASPGFTGEPLKPLIIGLDADLSAASALAGQSISRGVALAVQEINQSGGISGRPLAVKALDHRGNPARAIDNILELSEISDLVAIVGGLHTPAALEVLPIIHEKGIPFLIPWAAGTAVVENGYKPNYVFRVSIRDSWAGEFLVGKAKAAGHRKFGLLLENTGWGRSNRVAMTKALTEQDLPEPEIQWINWGAENVTSQLNAFKNAEVDVILLVANHPEGLTFIKEFARLPENQRVPVISHWGITGGTFFNDARSEIPSITLSFLYTFTFCNERFQPKADALFRLYSGRFSEYSTPDDIPAAPGLAHAYDLIHLLAVAIKKAGTSDRRSIQSALENIESYDGVMKKYQPPFTPDNHDALSTDCLILARFNEDGLIIPLK